MTKAIGAAILWVFWGWMAMAQTMAEQGIIVTGEGRVSAPPDMATITLGVRQRAGSAAAALEQTSTAIADILEQLDAVGVAKADRQTSRFYLNPIFDNNRKQLNDASKIIAYEAGNSVEVRVRVLENLGPILDAAAAMEINDFNGLSFTLQDPTEALAQARAAAVADATLRAMQLADAAGLALGAVLRMTENSHHGGPVVMAEARAFAGGAIAQGEVDVSASVTMVFGIDRFAR